MSNTNHIEEARRLLDLIDDKYITKERDYAFVRDIRATVKYNGFVGDKAIYWLRDIKDRQLESA